METIILDAGCAQGSGGTEPIAGLRLRNGETVLGRQLRILYNCGIDGVAVVAGNLREELEEIISGLAWSGMKIELICDPKYQGTGSMNALVFVRDRWKDKDVMVVSGGAVFTQPLMRAFLASEKNCQCLVDKGTPAREGHMAAKLDMDIVKRVDCGQDGAGWFAYPGLLKLDAAAMRRMEEFCAAQGGAVNVEQALDGILGDTEVRQFPVGDHYAAEVASAAELEQVREKVRYYDYDGQEVLNERGGILRIREWIEQANAKKLMVVCGDSYDKFPVAHVLEYLEIPAVECRMGAKPDYAEVLEGARLFQQEGCDMILSVGGAGVIDAAKCVKMFIAMESGGENLEQEPVYSPVQHAAVPTTAGCGAAATRYAFVERDGERICLAHDSMMPEYVLLDANMLHTLPYHKRKEELLGLVVEGASGALYEGHSRASRMEAGEKQGAVLDGALLYLKGYARPEEAALDASVFFGRMRNREWTMDNMGEDGMVRPVRMPPALHFGGEKGGGEPSWAADARKFAKAVFMGKTDKYIKMDEEKLMLLLGGVLDLSAVRG